MSSVHNNNNLDIEKGNYDYYLDETTSQNNNCCCCQRLCHGFIQHPFTLLEVNGRVIDVQRTFAPHPTWIILILKVLLLGVSIDVMVRDLVVSYDENDKTFYMAYFHNWSLAFTILYFFLSTINSLSCGGRTTNQPTAQRNRVSCNVMLTWFFYPVALAYQGLTVIAFWWMVYYNNNSQEDDNDESSTKTTTTKAIMMDVFTNVSYYTIMKSCGGLAFLLVLEGQVLNRIPLRYAHLVFMEFAFILYLGWSVLHHWMEIGNPDNDDNEDDDASGSSSSIYWFLNWTDPQAIPQTTLGCVITMLGVLPVMFMVLHLLSLPCRRYMPLIEPETEDDDDEEDAARRRGNNDDNGVLEIPIPSGRVGIVLTESNPPVVMEISNRSPLNDTGLEEGMVVDTLTLPDGTVFYNPMSSRELTTLLKETQNETDRVLRFLPPERVDELTMPPEEDEAPEEMEIPLPSGSIGLVFHKKSPPVIKSIKPSSPLLDMYPELQTGMVIDTLTLEDGTTHYEMATKELTVLLKEHRHSDGRTLIVKRKDQPLTPKPPEEDEEEADNHNNNDDEMPEEIMVYLPPGPMMVMLEGVPPQVTKMAPDSPLHDFGVVEGMVVDTLELPDGTVHYEMATQDCKVYLSQHADSDGGRVIRFIDPDRMPSTRAPMTIEEVKVVGSTGSDDVGGGGFDERLEDNAEEEEIRESLLSMGFEMDAVNEAIDHFKEMGEPLDADNCMTRIITQ